MVSLKKIMRKKEMPWPRSHLTITQAHVESNKYVYKPVSVDKTEGNSSTQWPVSNRIEAEDDVNAVDQNGESDYKRVGRGLTCMMVRMEMLMGSNWTKITLQRRRESCILEERFFYGFCCCFLTGLHRFHHCVELAYQCSIGSDFEIRSRGDLNFRSCNPSYLLQGKNLIYVWSARGNEAASPNQTI